MLFGQAALGMMGSRAAAAAAAFVASGADFSGTGMYYRRAGFTGVDAKTAFFRVLARFDGGTTVCLYDHGVAGATRFKVDLTSQGKVQIVGKNAAGTTILAVTGGHGLGGSYHTGWHEIMFSCDLSDTGKRFLYVNGEQPDNITWTTYSNDSIDWTVDDVNVASNLAEGSLMNGCLAELMVDDSYIDLSVQANREKFRFHGKPVDPGTDGATAIGVQPLIYLSIRSGGAAADFATNRGTGGNFTIIGTPVLSSDKPTDPGIVVRLCHLNTQAFNASQTYTGTGPGDGSQPKTYNGRCVVTGGDMPCTYSWTQITGSGWAIGSPTAAGSSFVYDDLTDTLGPSSQTSFDCTATDSLNSSSASSVDLRCDMVFP